jgi:hypothetical protein
MNNPIRSRDSGANKPHSANSRRAALARFGSWQMAAVADAER